MITDDPFEIVEGRAELIVELIGGLEPARSLIERALQLGKSVVTANKRVIARHGRALEQLARKRGGDLLYSASVGGALPAIEAVANAARGNRIRRIDAVLSGTCNFVLDATADGVPFDEAVGQAQEKGFAEADPTLDLDGTDTAEKLAILAERAFGVHVEPDAVSKRGIRDAPLRSPSCGEARVRLVATCERRGNAVDARVRPRLLPADHPLAAPREEQNALVLELDSGERRVVTGRGAGRWPTTEAVVADLLDCARTAGEQSARRFVSAS